MEATFKGALPEKCLVTLLVVDVADSTAHVADCDPDEIQSFQDQIFERVQACINEASGHVISFAGDGGIAVFGWPNSLEPHADCALGAARQIVRIATGQFPIFSPAGKKVCLRVGVHSGLVGMRHITLASVTRTDTVGETVHLAVALEKAAPVNTVLVSSDTIDLCSQPPAVTVHPGVSAFDDRGYLVFRLAETDDDARTDAKPSAYKTAMIGRETELARLEAIMPTSESRFQSLGLTGEAGIGKSRLVAEFVARAEARGCTVITVSGDGGQRASPFLSARLALEELIRLSNAGIQQMRRILMSKHGFTSDEADLIMVVLGQSITDRTGRQGARTHIRVPMLIGKVFERLGAGRQLLIVIEDAHWVDPESMESFRLLSRKIRPGSCSLVVTGRLEARKPIEEMAGSLLQLEPLDQATMQKLAQDRVGGRKLAREDLERAVEKADGIPFVLEQILLSIDPLSAGARDFMPLSIQSLIHARLNQLSNDAKQLAQTLSVLGQETSRSIVTKVVSDDTAGLSRNLDELKSFEFLFPDSQTIKFRHPIICEACALTVPRKRAQALHRAAIRAISATFTNLEPRYMSLAFHAHEAGDREKEIDYLWRAAQHARRTSAMLSLKTIFDLATAAIGENPAGNERLRLDFALMAGPALLHVGEFGCRGTASAEGVKLCRAGGHRGGIVRNALPLRNALLVHRQVRTGEGVFVEGQEHGPQAGQDAALLLGAHHPFHPVLGHSRHHGSGCPSGRTLPDIRR